MSNQKPSTDIDRIHAEESRAPMPSNPERLMHSNRRLISGRSVTLPQNFDIGVVDSVQGGSVKDVIDDDATQVRSTMGSAGTPSPPFDKAKNFPGGSATRQEMSITLYNENASSGTRDSSSEDAMSANTQMPIAAEVDKAIERKQSLILSSEVEAVRQSLEALGYPTPAEINQMVDDAKRESEEAAQAFLANHDKIDKIKMALMKTVSTDYFNESI